MIIMLTSKRASKLIMGNHYQLAQSWLKIDCTACTQFGPSIFHSTHHLLGFIWPILFDLKLGFLLLNPNSDRLFSHKNPFLSNSFGYFYSVDHIFFAVVFFGSTQRPGTKEKHLLTKKSFFHRKTNINNWFFVQALFFIVIAGYQWNMNAGFSFPKPTRRIWFFFTSEFMAGSDFIPGFFLRRPFYSVQ